MKTNRFFAVTLALVLVAGLGTPAFAGITPAVELITFEFEMEVTQISLAEFPEVAIAQDVEVGDTITGSYTFDANAVGFVDLFDTFYPFENVMLTVDGEFFQSTPPFTPIFDSIFVGDNVFNSIDEYGLQDTTLRYVGDVESEISAAFVFSLQDTDQIVFDDESLPLIPPNVADFEGNIAILGIGPESIIDGAESFSAEDIAKLNLFPGGTEIRGVITSLTLPDQVVGGELLSIDSTALLLASAQTFSWMIPLVLSGIGIGLFVVSRKSENS